MPPASLGSLRGRAKKPLTGYRRRNPGYGYFAATLFAFDHAP